METARQRDRDRERKKARRRRSREKESALKSQRLRKKRKEEKRRPAAILDKLDIQLKKKENEESLRQDEGEEKNPSCYKPSKERMKEISSVAFFSFFEKGRGFLTI